MAKKAAGSAGKSRENVQPAKGPKARDRQGANHADETVWMTSIRDAPVFRPTEEDFKDPLAYIRKIHSEAEPWGICKIIPPVKAATAAWKELRGPDDKKLEFHTRYQPVAERPLERMEVQRFETSAKPYTIREYNQVANETEGKLLGVYGGIPDHIAEAAYWKRRAGKDKKAAYVEYGNDVEGTAFSKDKARDPLAKTDWNMRVLPKVATSTLHLLPGEIPGVTTPMLYIGMASATFAWHTEDHYLYSINYQHQGAAKTWYGVAGSDADGFERVAKEYFRKALQTSIAEGTLTEADIDSKVHEVLLGKTTMFSPKLLIDADVKVCRAVQKPGEFVVTFPRAYHGGFSHGFSIGEAVNFATRDWFLFGADCSARYRRVQQAPILPHEHLLCSASAELCKRLRRQKTCTYPDEDRSLAGTFVDIIRQQNLQRACLMDWGAQQYWKETDHMADCCKCKKLSYITVAIDGKADAGHEETLCLDCAVAMAHPGCKMFILCSKQIKELEDRARWLEQHSLLKGRTADWQRMRKGRGLEECQLHGCGHGVLPLPLPTEAFQWQNLPDPIAKNIQGSFLNPEEIHFPEVVCGGPGMLAADADLALEALASSEDENAAFHPSIHLQCALPVQQAQPPLSAGSQLHWQPNSGLTGSRQASQPAVQPQHDAQLRGSHLLCADLAPGRHMLQHSEQAKEHGRQAHLPSRRPAVPGDAEMLEAPALHRSSEGAADSVGHAAVQKQQPEARGAAEKIRADSELRPQIFPGAFVRQPQRVNAVSAQNVMKGAALSWDPLLLKTKPVKNSAQPVRSPSNFRQQDAPQPGGELGRLEAAQQGDLPIDAGKQNAAGPGGNMPSKGRQQKAAQPGGLPGKGRQQKAAGPGSRPGKGAQQMAAQPGGLPSKGGTKRKFVGDRSDSGGSSFTEQPRGPPPARDGAGRQAGAACNPSWAVSPARMAPAPPAASPGHKKARLLPPAGRAAAGGPLAVAGQQTGILGLGGHVYPRTVFHLQSNDSVRMLDLRELTKATGMVNQFSAKVSTKDMSRRLWQQALQKAEEEHISPGVITDVPQSHAYYGSPQAARFLLGIEHVQTLYFIADSKERMLLDTFCGDVWPEQYAAKVPAAAFTSAPNKEGSSRPGSSTCTAAGHMYLIPGSPNAGQADMMDWEYSQMAPDSMTKIQQEAKGSATKAFLHYAVSPQKMQQGRKKRGARQRA